MARDDVAQRIADTCNELGEVELSGIALETADRRLLDLNCMGFDQHVAMHPSAVAYYGMLLRNSDRELAAFERVISRWEKKKWAEAKASLANVKTTVADVEARFVVDNESEIESHEKRLDELRAQNDALSVWFDAWKQKGFSMKDYAGIESEEKWGNKFRIDEERQSAHSGKHDSVAKVRGIIQRRRESSGTDTGE